MNDGDIIGFGDTNSGESNKNSWLVGLGISTCGWRRWSCVLTMIFTNIRHTLPVRSVRTRPPPPRQLTSNAPAAFGDPLKMMNQVWSLLSITPPPALGRLWSVFFIQTIIISNDKIKRSLGTGRWLSLVFWSICPCTHDQNSRKII